VACLAGRSIGGKAELCPASRGRPAARPAPEKPRPPRAQACLAWRTDGGRVVVVLSQRDKLAMEGDFRRLLPPAARFGTRFVFRQARARGRRPEPCAAPPAPQSLCVLRRSRLQNFGKMTLCQASLCALRCGPATAPRAAL
jgi:hypothetical protein